MSHLDYESPQPRRGLLVRMDDPVRVQLLVALLERAGIEAEVLNQNSTGFGAPVACQILVRSEDRHRAEEVLRDFLEGRMAVVEGDDDGDGAPRCPKCRSWQVQKRINLWHDLLRFFKLMPPPESGITSMECLRCGNEWDD